MKKIIILFLIFMYSLSFSELILDIDNTQLSDGETAILSLIVKDIKISEYEIQGIEKFKILSKGQSSNTQIINGKKSSSKTYQFRILPLKKGKLRLKAIGKYKKESFDSNELEIEVSNQPKRTVDLNFYLNTSLAKERYYFGEKIILSHHLITTVNVNNFGFIDESKYTDFTEKDITQKGFEGKYIRVNGKKAIDYTVYKAILEPLKSGEFNLPARNFQVNTDDSNSFFSNATPHYLKTRGKKIEILELPSENKPVEFSGVVGVMKSEYKFDKTEVKLGEAINLTIKLRGNVNLDTLEELYIDKAVGVKTYQSIKDVKEYVVDNKYTVEKEYEIVFIPQNGGEQVLPELKIPFFNTETEQYESLRIPGQQILVNGKSTLNNTPNELSKISSKQELSISQIQTIEGKIEKKPYIIVITFLIMTNILTIFILIYHKRAKKKAGEENAEIKKIKKKIEKSKTIEDAYSLYNEGMKRKFGLSIKSYSSEQIAEMIDVENSTEIEEVISELEKLRYFNQEIDSSLIKRMLQTL